MGKYKKILGPTRRCNYNPVYMANAIKAVKSGKQSMRQASEQYGVPYTTLNDKINDRYSLNMGGQTALNKAEEKNLVEGLLCCSKWGFPLKKNDVQNVVQNYLNRKGKVEKRFRDNRPGRAWLHGFMTRNNELSARMAENVKRVRAAVSRKTLLDYFDNLERSISGVPPSNLVNYDETNFSDDPGQVRVLVKRGAKHPERVLDSSKTSISVMMAAAADGTVLPPYTVYKSKHLYDLWQEGGIEGAGYNRNSSGWFDLVMFEAWFFQMLLPYFKKLEGLKVMIGDNLSSHLSIDVIKACEQNNVRFVLLPANSTHLCQPLDVAFFRPLKAAWRSVLDNWKQHNRGVMPKSEFPRLLKESFEKIGTHLKQNVQSGFTKAGIFPLCPRKVLDQLPEQDTSEGETSWTAAFEDHLKRARLGETTTVTNRRAKRINLPPGKGIVARDIQTRNKDSEISACVAAASSFDYTILSDTSDNEDSSKDPESVEEIPRPKNSEVKNNVTENDFVIVEFPTKRTVRYFVGRIEKIDGDFFEVIFLRKRNLDGNIFFVFPDVEDGAEIDISQIIEKIEPICGRRGKYRFSNIEAYNLE